jgi:hypothetical protein
MYCIKEQVYVKTNVAVVRAAVLAETRVEKRWCTRVPPSCPELKLTRMHLGQLKLNLQDKRPGMAHRSLLFHA